MILFASMCTFKISYFYFVIRILNLFTIIVLVQTFFMPKIFGETVLTVETIERISGPFEVKNYNGIPAKGRFMIFVIAEFRYFKNQISIIQKELNTEDPEKNQHIISSRISSIQKRSSDVCAVIDRLSKSNLLDTEGLAAAQAIQKLNLIFTKLKGISIDQLYKIPFDEFSSKINRLIKEIKSNIPDFESSEAGSTNMPTKPNHVK